MKNSLFLLGAAAVVALSSCSQSEVMEVAESRAIGFNAFVDNNTKAAAEELNKKNLTKFNVFGYHGVNTPDYTNTLVTGSGETNTWTIAGQAYWKAGEAYEFAAYSDGNNSLTDENVSFDNKTLTIENYTVGTRDLIAAQTSVAAQEDMNNYSNVPLNFRHMLSQIKFSFKNADTRDYIMKISDLKIIAGIKGTGKYTIFNNEPVITWNIATEGGSGEYTIKGIEDIAEGELNEYHGTESILILPQTNDNLKVTFTVLLTDKDNKRIAEGDFTASIDSDINSTYSSWKPGFCYNYTATINGSDVPVDPTDPETKPKEIKFSVEEVDGWKPIAGSTMDPENVDRE